jgi:rhamnosyl/mannosyltransferase
MSALRVLHLGKFYSPVRGGMETALQNLCGGERHSVSTRALVVNRTRGTRHDVVDGVPVTRVGSLMRIGAVALAPTLPIWLARAEADLIVLHEPNPMALVAYFFARPRASLIVWYHAEVLRPRWRYRLFYQPLLKFALRRASRIVVASPPMKDVAPLAAHRNKCVVIAYGVECDRYRATEAVTATANALRTRIGSPFLLFIGRLVSYKGLDVLLDALPGLAAHAVIIGEGPQRPAIEALIRGRGLEERVHLIGDVSDTDLVAWLHACTVAVLPSTTRQEAFGLVQLEAMLCGRPVVSTDVPTGVSWVNVDGETGLVVPAGDAGALHGALLRLLTDDELRRAMGAAAQKRVLERFTADRMRAAASVLYEEVAGTTASAHPSTHVGTQPVRAGGRSS